MQTRRRFLECAGSGLGVAVLGTGLGYRKLAAATMPPLIELTQIRAEEDIFAYVRRVQGAWDNKLYQQILGAANAFKEGDAFVGVAAADETSRSHARALLANSRVSEIDAHPPFEDALFKLLNETLDRSAAAKTSKLTLGELKHFLLTEEEDAIKSIMPGLSSDVIGCVVKLMSNQELVALGAKVFNILPGSQIGAQGYCGARVQPNSPTDNVDDIRWQVFDGWSYAVGDVLLGNNPVSSEPESVAAIQQTLQDLLDTFELSEVMPHCVLSHIDVQAEVEQASPGSTTLWFQSIGGCDTANATFDISLEKMQKYASMRTGKYGFYFESGQGADFTNGHGHGFDMVLHESRKYGLTRALTKKVAEAQARSGSPFEPWVHLNDVAGFIGPEVFRTREQLVRCCLEDIVMGKLHGLCIGLDVCSTLHMDISLDDLDWCLDQVLPANPAYLMALPTKIDPMLGYLTTGFQDHVRIREKFGTRVNDPMWQFYQQLGVLDQQGRPTRHFGDPLWVYLQYCRKKGDLRSEDEILREGTKQLEEVRRRGVFVAQGYGEKHWDLEPQIEKNIQRIYADAKKSIWAELKPAFIAQVPEGYPLETQSTDRSDYILHPVSGEQLHETSLAKLRKLRKRHAGKYDVQIVVSDGLNAHAIMDEGHLAPFLEELRNRLVADGYQPSPEHVIVTSGRVRAGYRIGETLFADLPKSRALLHVIGERPGTGHHTFSVYTTSTAGSIWGKKGQVDHNITKVVSGVATTALAPVLGANRTVHLLNAINRRQVDSEVRVSAQ